jgi:hypothetical protein
MKCGLPNDFQPPGKSSCEMRLRYEMEMRCLSFCAANLKYGICEILDFFDLEVQQYELIS